MVIGKFPVVEALLAHFLCGHYFGHLAAQGVENAGLLGRSHLEPTCHVATGKAFCLLGVDHVGEPLACESLFAHVAAPCDGVAVHHSIVDNTHHVFHRHVP